MTKRRVTRYPKEFRQMAVERMRNCGNISALARELGIDRTVLYYWHSQAPPGEDPWADDLSRTRALRKELRDLKRVLAEKTLEVDFFKGALQKVAARRRSSSGSGETASTRRSGN